MDIQALRERLLRMPPKTRWLASGIGGVLLLVLLFPRDSVSSMAVAQQGMELMPEDIATVRFAPLAAALDFSGTLVPVREGEAVAAGAVLVRQDSRDMRAQLAQAEAAVQSSRAQFQNASEQAGKYRQLSMNNYFSRSDLDKSTTQAAVYESQLKANEAQVVVARKALENALLRSPFSGVVAERMVEPGQLVMPNTPLLRVVDLSELELAIQLPATEIARVQKGQKVSFRAEAFGDTEFTGVITRLNPMAKASNRKIIVYALVKNADLRLRGGLFVHGRVEGTSDVSGLVIPATAVQTRDGKPGVMVVRHQRLAWQPVTLGPRDERSGNVLVSAGVVEGETVLATRVPIERAGSPVRLAEAADLAPHSGG